MLQAKLEQVLIGVCRIMWCAHKARAARPRRMVLVVADEVGQQLTNSLCVHGPIPNDPIKQI